MKKRSVMTGLRSLRVRDVMNRNIIKVGKQQRMIEIAKIFLDRDISAAPVIDDYGRCVGIVSATDFLRRDIATCGPAIVPLQNATHISQSSEHNERCAIASDERDVASTYMTSSVQTSSADALLFTAAMMMTSEHIQHLPVLDEQNHVVGMMSTMDKLPTRSTRVSPMPRHAKWPPCCREYGAIHLRSFWIPWHRGL